MHRRRLLLGAGGILLIGGAAAQGQPGVRRVRGSASVNGQPAKTGIAVRAGDRVTTGGDGELAFVVGRDATLVRSGATVEVLKDGLRLLTGAALTVFQPRSRRELRTPTATIGIRGTAVYLRLEPRRTYACTCYGEAVLEPVDEPGARETVRTRAHEQPRYIAARGAPQMLAAAPVLDHTDAELRFLEGLL